VAVVSHAFAALVWPGQNAIGKAFTFGPGGKPVTVIGVAGDQHLPITTSDGITTAGWPNVYFSERQAVSSNLMMLEIRTTGPAEALMGFVQSRMQYASPDVQAFFVRPPALSTGGETFMILRVTEAIVGFCAGLALFLSLVGLYASIGYAIALRRREIGVRLALGGTVGQIRAHITGGGMRVVGLGLAGGVVLALPVALLMRSMLWGVSPFSVGVYAAVCALFAGIALAACHLASRRTLTLDPMIALRAE
jgi:ABC-type antimicrobial peptide transport system permease subunit